MTSVSIVPSHFVFPQVILENGTTTADNQSILPSKKKKVRRTNADARQTKPIAKKKLSKKERKRLEKILQVKKKKAQVSSPFQQPFTTNRFSSLQRVDLLHQLSEVQISNDELALLHSIKHIGNKAKRYSRSFFARRSNRGVFRPLAEPAGTSEQETKVSLHHLAKKRAKLSAEPPTK